MRIALYAGFTKIALSRQNKASGGKDECQLRLTGIEREYWMGTEIGRLGDYSSRGKVTAGDGSNQKVASKINLGLGVA